MTVRTNSSASSLVRLVLAMLAALALLLVAALATPTRADAHQMGGRTLIRVDGDLVKSTKDDHFTYSRRLSPGCHTVNVVRKQGGEVVSRSIRRFCSSEPTRLVVKVDDNSVSSSTHAVNNTSDSDSA